MKLAEAVANKVATTGAGASMASAGVVQVQTVWGYTVNEWTVLIGLGGLMVGVLGFIVSTAIKVIDHKDKRRHRREILEAAKQNMISSREQ